MTKWSTLSADQRRDLITAAWLEGKSSNEIASGIDGATRNSISGYIHRAHLKRPQRPVLFPSANPKQWTERPRVVPDKPWEPMAGAHPISILELGTHSCRWPVDGGFCGLHANKVYCDAHHKVAYVKMVRA